MEQENKEHSYKGKIIAVIIIGIMIVFFIGQVRNMRMTTPSITKINPVTIDTTTVYDSDGTIIDTTTVTPPVTKWSYSEDLDKMTNKKTKFASIEANELLFFKSPYDGGVTATVTIRNKNGDLDIYLRISKGQFMDTSNGGTVKIKFDEGEARTYNFVGAADYSSDIIFFRSEYKLLQKIRKSKKMLIEALFYSEGNRVMEFETKDLKF